MYSVGIYITLNVNMRMGGGGVHDHVPEFPEKNIVTLNITLSDGAFHLADSSFYNN